jgi:hypothetical protein
MKKRDIKDITSRVFPGEKRPREEKRKVRPYLIPNFLFFDCSIVDPFLRTVFRILDPVFFDRWIRDGKKIWIRIRDSG